MCIRLDIPDPMGGQGHRFPPAKSSAGSSATTTTTAGGSGGAAGGVPTGVRRLERFGEEGKGGVWKGLGRKGKGKGKYGKV